MNPRSEDKITGQEDYLNYSSSHLGSNFGVIQPINFPSLPDQWTSKWETFPSSDGHLKLFSVTHMNSEAESHRALVILHGLGEHGGRYFHFPHYLKSEVSSIVCLDHRGHGRSEGLRGHIERFDSYADDVALAITRLDEILQKKFGKSEIHLLGHSMGGLIVLRTLFLYTQLPICSATVSAPLLAVKARVPTVKKSAAILLSKVWGSCHMTSELNPSDLSHDKEVVDAYQKDRLVHSKFTPKFFTQLMEHMEDTIKKDFGMNYSLQMLLPLQDKIVDSQVSLKFFRDLKLRDKLLKTYPDMFHEPFNELGKDEVFEDLRSWMRAHSVP